MNLPESLERAARALGESLHQSEPVLEYLHAQAELLADEVARGLDTRHQEMYQELMARQRSGEQLPQDEVDAFFALQTQARNHPLIAKRNASLVPIQTYFTDVELELSREIGLSFTDYATRTELEGEEP